MYALGIDLGTTYTAAATWRNGHAETQSLGSRSAAIPSVVLLREDETFVTGETANRRGLTEPHRVAREFKRRLGDTTPIMLGGVPYSAEALMARLLRTVVDEVGRREGGPPKAITVSHPANWGPYKTDLLLQAVRIAGLDEPVSFTTEPEAAAVFYSQQQRIEPGAIVAVYDLGGGTFDAAVLRKKPVGFEILGKPEGIERLGGIDFDAAVFAHVAKALGGKLEELDEDDPAVIAAVARLREEVVEAKEALSSDTDVSIPVLLPNISTEIRLTRAELEAMVRPALSDSIEALKRALRSANVTPDQLHSVLLVGGSSRMPLVAQLVGAELGRPVAVDAHPKHAVSLGAAWLASGALSATAPERAVTGASGTATRGTATVGGAAVPPEAPTILPAPIPTPASTPTPSPAPAPVAAPAARSSGTASVPVAPSPLVSTQIGSTGSVYGAPPGPPAPPTGAGGQRRPFPLIAAGVALLLVLGGGGLALALTRNNNQGQGQGTPPTSAAASAPATSAPAPVVPADEQCTDAIKSNPRWVCLTKATLDDEKIVIEYEAEWNGSNPSISNGFHLHIYGGDGRNPPDRIMGTHSNNQGDWYVEDEQPSVKSVNSDEFRNAGLGDNPKVCARIARAGHALVRDNSGDNTYRTGNCVPITRAN
jgi:actin-like ATPase involved in cell morphogenesis